MWLSVFVKYRLWVDQMILSIDSEQCISRYAKLYMKVVSGKWQKSG